MAEKRFGDLVPDWTAPKRPPRETLLGRYAEVVPLNVASQGAELFARYDGHDAVWDYLPYGPFPSLAAYETWLRSVEPSEDPQFFAIRDLDAGRYAGVASYLRVDPQAGSIEVGHINFSPALQGTRAATEALFLMMRWAFEAGYRRFEWKCDALNVPSRRAAQRLGLSYEGVFRQATVVKGRNRDTAWFAAIDAEWPDLRDAFERWLDAENFDPVTGAQRAPLSEMTAPIRAASDPAFR